MIVVRNCFIAKPGNERFRAKMKGYTDLYLTGSREILQVM